MTHRSTILAGSAIVALVAGASLALAADKPVKATAPQMEPAPAAAPTTDSPAAGVKLSEVRNPKTALKGAAVKDAKGESIGEVKSVKMASNGELEAVNVMVGTREIALVADTLTYVQADKTIVSTKTKAEIEAAP